MYFIDLFIFLLFSQVLDLSLRLEKELSALRSSLEEEQRKQLTLIKQVSDVLFIIASRLCLFWFSPAVILEPFPPRRCTSESMGER